METKYETTFGAVKVEIMRMLEREITEAENDEKKK